MLLGQRLLGRFATGETEDMLHQHLPTGRAAVIHLYYMVTHR